MITSNVLPLFSRPLREVPGPLALFLRPGHHHHQELAEAISVGPPALHGVVFDAASAARQQALREAVRNRKLYSVLDPQTQQLTSVPDASRHLAELPWAGMRQTRPKT